MNNELFYLKLQQTKSTLEALSANYRDVSFRKELNMDILQILETLTDQSLKELKDIKKEIVERMKEEN